MRSEEVFSQLFYDIIKFNSYKFMRMPATRLICYCDKQSSSNVSTDIQNSLKQIIAYFEPINCFVNIAKEGDNSFIVRACIDELAREALPDLTQLHRNV